MFKISKYGLIQNLTYAFNFDRPLPAYNSLMDPHLAGYFGNRKMRRHLRKQGLVSEWIQSSFSAMSWWIHWIWWQKKFQSKGFDRRTSSVEGHCANYCTTQPSVNAIMFKSSTRLVYASLLLKNSLTVPVKTEKLECAIYIHFTCVE